jgi:MFS family permease
VIGMQRHTLPDVPEAERARSLGHSLADGNAHAITMGLGEAYLAPFAIFLGADNLLIGLLASLPLCVGALAQLWVAAALDRVKRRRGLCVWPAVAQGLSFLPLLFLPYALPGHAAELALLGALLYFVAGSVVVPPWNSWIADLVPPATRGDYFGRRNKLRTYFQVGGVLLAGLVLSVARDHDVEHLGFVVIFLIALSARLLSAYHIARMVEPEYHAPPLADRFTFRDFVRRSPWANFGRFTWYAAVFLAATNISGPYFTPYMLNDLRFSYAEFTLASVSFILAQAVVIHNWGRVADRFGNRKVLAVTGLSLPVIPWLWLLSADVLYVLFLQVIAGFIWAGFYLSVANFLFDAVTPAKRARCVAYYNTLTNLGLLVGAVTGGFIAEHVPQSFSVAGLDLTLDSKLHVLFALSGFLRLLFSLVFLPFIREVRPVEPAGTWQVVVQLVGLSPIRGLRLSVFAGQSTSEPRSRQIAKRAGTAPRDDTTRRNAS